MTHWDGFYDEGFLGHSYDLIKETARATVSVVERKISKVEIHGATVKAADINKGTVSVHIDGDDADEVTTVATIDDQFYDWGTRVLVMLAPPSFAIMLGTTGHPPLWTPYGQDPQPPLWTTDFQKQVTATGSNTVNTPSGSPSPYNTSNGVSFAQGKMYVVAVAVVGSPTSTQVTVTGVVNSGTDLGWTKVAEQSQAQSGSHPYKHISLWKAYDTAGIGFATISLVFTGDSTGYEFFTELITLTNAKQVQTGAASAQNGTHASQSITTTDDHSIVLGIACCDNYPNTNLAVSAGASTTLLHSNTTSLYRGESVGYRQVTAAGSGTVAWSWTGTSIFTGISCAMEVLGVSDAPVIGDGISVGYYRLHGHAMDIRVEIVAGAATTLGTGTYRIQLPPGFSASDRPIGGIQAISGILVPAGTNRYRAAAEIAAGATQFDKVIYQDASTQYWDSTHPVTTTGLRLALQGTIEVEVA